MKLSVKVRKWHRWLALLVGVQVLLWTASGLFMSFVPIETVRSEDVINKKVPIFLNDLSQYISLDVAAKSLKVEFGKIEEIKLRYLVNNPVYEFINEKGVMALVNARSAELISPISEELVRKIVLSKYSGSSSIKSINLITTPVIEFRGKYPIWRIDIDDSASTSFYVHPEDGSLKGVRGNFWRIYDFLWMLHIMDYNKRESFNHWWLVLAAFLAVSVSITGFILFFYSFRKRDFLFFK